MKDRITVTLDADMLDRLQRQAEAVGISRDEAAQKAIESWVRFRELVAAQEAARIAMEQAAGPPTDAAREPERVFHQPWPGPPETDPNLHHDSAYPFDGTRIVPVDDY